MQDLLKKRIERIKFPIREIAASQNTPNYSSNSYNLKEQLDQLIGPEDFHYKLESVNLVIGFIITALLSYFFIL